MARVSEAKTARKMRGVLRAQIGRPCRDVPALLQVKFADERPQAQRLRSAARWLHGGGKGGGRKQPA